MGGRLWADLRLASRTIRREPRYSASVLATISVGVAGAALVTSFSVGVAFFPLPYRDLPRLVSILETTRGDCPRCVDAVTNGRFLAWRDASRHDVAHISEISASNSTLVVQGDTTRSPVAAVDSQFFPALGVSPSIGSVVDFTRHAGAIISYDFWRRTFGSSRAVLGEVIKLAGTSYPIAGIMPRGFDYPPGTSVWIPLTPAMVNAAGDGPAFTLVARMRPGLSVPQLRQALTTIHDPSSNASDPALARGAAVFSLESTLRGAAQGPIAVLLGTVALIFLMACTTAAGLMVTRAVGRRQEFAVRQALGANRIDILRVLLCEVGGFVFIGGICAGAAALLVSGIVARVVESQLGIPLWFNVTGPLIAITAALTACVFFIVSAITVPTMARLDRIDTLRESGYTTTANKASVRLRQSLSTIQVAVSIVLLGCATLLGKSYKRGLRSDVGFRADSLYVTDVVLDSGRTGSGVVAYAAAKQLEDALQLSNGDATAEVWSSIRPHLFEPGAETIVLDGDRRAPSSGVPVESYDVDSAFFRFMGLHLLRGRVFRASDDANAPRVVIVNAVAAARLWPGRSALGQRFRLGPREAGTPWMTVIGVVSNSQPIAAVGSYLAATDEARYFPLMWRPLAQVSPTHLMVGVRAARPHDIHDQDVIGQLRTVWTTAPAPFKAFRAEMMAEWPFPEIRANAELLFGWSIYGAILAVLGAAALATDGVRRRQREIGIRMALGATGGQVIWLFCREAATMVLVAAIGASGAFVLFERPIGRVFFGVTNSNPTGVLLGMQVVDPALLMVEFTLFVFVLAATFVASRRAAKVDPARTTRSL